MNKLKWWLRIVGGWYMLIGLAGFLLPVFVVDEKSEERIQVRLVQRNFRAAGNVVTAGSDRGRVRRGQGNHPAIAVALRLRPHIYLARGLGLRLLGQSRPAGFLRRGNR